MSSQSVATIAASGTTSDAVKLSATHAVHAVAFPAAMTGTAVAVHGSFDGVTFLPVYRDGSAYTITFVASSIHQINPAVLFGLSHFKLVSNGTEAAERKITISHERVL
jgi:hypothetical protein